MTTPAPPPAGQPGSPITEILQYVVTQGSLVVNVKDYGAKGDGVTDDSSAFRQAAATGRPVFIPSGNYVFTGAGISGLSAPVFIGADKSRTTITLSAGGFFLDDNTAWTSMHIADITFTGGSGAIRNKWVGVNVNGVRAIERCVFQQYTGCAVSSNATDEPYWNFIDCQFSPANAVASIGIALAGSTDGSNFIGCSFIGNRIGVKLRKPFTPHFHGCDFLPGSDSVNPSAKLWLVPNAAARGGVYLSCKFGNEGINSLCYHVIIADDAAPSGLVGDSFPVLGADSTGTLSGMQFQNCDVQGSTGGAPAFIYSTTPDLRGFTVGPLNIVGTPPTYVVQFRTPPTASRLNLDSIVGPIIGSDTLGTDGLPPTASNGNGWGRAVDPQSVFTGPNDVAVNAAGDATSYAKLLTVPVNSFSQVAAALTQVTDATGGTDAAEANFTDVAGFFYASLAAPTVGKPVWVEFDAQAGATTPLASFFVQLQYTSNGAIHFRRYMTIPAAGGWVRRRFLWVPREATTTINLMFWSAGALGRVRIGRVRCYHSREPVPERLYLPDVITATTAPAAGGAAALPATPSGYMTVNLNGTLRQVAYY